MKTPTPSGEKIDRTVRWCPTCSGDRERSDRCSHDQARVFDCPEPGTMITQSYEYISMLGVGGMGVVYKCRNIHLEKVVAIKTLVARSFAPEELIRFQQEAKAAGKFNHPNLVSILDFGITDDGMPFMAMEYLEGETLDEAVAGNKLNLLQLISVFRDCCDALAYAHRHGVLHRDLKPANVMLTAVEGERTTKVLDFGIAKIADAGQLNMALTKTGSIFGTPPYMSPEQCSGGTVSNRSDVYSLACVMYEALSGRRPFLGNTALETFELHRNALPEPLPGKVDGMVLPLELHQVITKMLSKKADDRPSMDAVRFELDQIAERIVEQLEAEPEKIEEAENSQSPWTKKNGTSVAMIVAVVIGLAGLAIAYFWHLLNAGFDVISESRKVFSKKHDRVVATSEAVEFDKFSKARTELQLGRASIHFEDDEFSSDHVASLSRQAVNLHKLRLYHMRLVTAQKIRALRALPIENLRLIKCDVNDEVLQTVGECFKEKLTEFALEMEEPDSVTEEGLLALAGCHKVKGFGFVNVKSLTSRVVKTLLQNNKALIGLDMTKCKSVDDETVKIVSAYGTGLHSLSLSHTSVSSACVNDLCRLKQLQLLILNGTYLHDGDIAKLASSLPKLHGLELRGQKYLTDKCLLPLAERQKRKGVEPLFRLVCDYNGLSKDSVATLSQMQSLRLLSLCEIDGITAKERRLLRTLLPTTTIQPGEPKKKTVD